MDLCYFLVSFALFTSVAPFTLPYGPTGLHRNVSFLKRVKRSDRCAERYCHNGGYCDIEHGRTVCRCPENYSGEYCQIMSCTSGFCKNGGRCFIDRGRRFCHCTERYIGEYCERDRCTMRSCDNGGTCDVENRRTICRCIERYIGEFCEIDLCAGKQCRNGGDCEIENGRPVCKCTSRYTGENCEIASSSITYCQHPGDINNGRVLHVPSLDSRIRPYYEREDGYPEGTQLLYSCDDGYTLEGFSTLTCQSTGRWSSRSPTCKKVVYCQDPGDINNGRVVHVPNLDHRMRPYDEREDGYPEGSQIQYSCDDGYTLEGASTLTCQSTGRWSSRSPTCKKVVYCQDPGDINNGQVIHVPKLDHRIRPYDEREDRYPEGSQLQYSCDDGYTLKGTSILTCQSTGSWSSRSPTCKKDMIYCESPEPFPNGRVVHQLIGRSVSSVISLDDDILYQEGSRLNYSCNVGYALIGSTSLICEKSGLWSAKPPVCIRHCSKVDSPKFGSVRCISKSEQHPKCKLVENLGLRNRVPRQINSAKCPPKDDRSSFLLETCTGTCLPGYHFTTGMENEMTLTCRGGVWTPRTSFLDCQSPTPLAYCLYPGDITNGRVYISTLNEKRRSFDEGEEEYPEGSRLKYSCVDGFVLKGPTSLICTNISTWSAAPPTCIPAPRPLTYCQYPGDIINGRVIHFPNLNERMRPYDEIEDEYPEGSRLKYSCNAGYILEGFSVLTCQSTGNWSSIPPTCEIDVWTEFISCKNPGLISNGWAEYNPPPMNQSRDPIADEYPEQSVLKYSCDEGYRLQGHHSVTCLPTGSWSGDIPSCVPDCGRSFTQTHNRVANGSETIPGDWPWVVSISVENNGRTSFKCGGAILNTHVVITVAHCLAHPEVLGKRLILHFGKHLFGVEDDEVLERKSSRVIIHPDYSNKTFDSDIALVFFKQSIQYSARVQPLCLPTPDSTAQNIVPGKIGSVSGWGLTEDQVAPDMMMSASFPVISNRQCMDAYKEKNLLMTSNMFCAGYEDVRQSLCSGDSGSPFVFYDKKIKRYILEGLVSFAENGKCGVAGKYTIFTKVFRFLDWIVRLYNIRNEK